VLRFAPWSLIGATLILVAGFTDGARVWLWIAALAVTYVGAALAGSTGWRCTRRTSPSGTASW
jgi:low temperature requirement protein LtrA